MRSKFLSIFAIAALAAFLLTLSLAVPILWRGFYYGQIDSLQLVEQTGYSREVIVEAYDAIMDYLVFDAPYSTGQLPSSSDGQAHFADCRVLFQLDFIVLGISGFLLALLVGWCKVTHTYLPKLAGRGICFWTFITIAALFMVVLVWAVVDFGSLFTVFHMTFFPGKTNWVFDIAHDPIVLILPERFWMAAGGLVIGLMFGLSALLAVAESKLNKKIGKA